MRLTSKVALIQFLAIMLLTSCTRNSTIPPITAGQANVALTMSDTPAAGVTLLSFQLTVTGAVLQPGDVSLVSSPILVDLQQLQAETALLSLNKVPAGTYSSIAITFANPQLAFVNNSAAPVGGCAAGAACTLQPSINPAMVTYNASPFPLTISGNSSVGLHLDFNVNNSLQSDLSIQPAITFGEFLPGSNSAPAEEVDSLFGMLKSVDSANRQFNLQLIEPSTTLPLLTVATNNQTQYVYFDQMGFTNDFSGLTSLINTQSAQELEVDAVFAAGGNLTARKVVFKAPPQPNERGGGGTIVSLTNPLTQFNVAIFQDQGGEPAGASSLVTVTLDTNTQFNVDAEGLNLILPLGVSFAGPNDLLQGQNSSQGVALVAEFIADHVTLEKSFLTATVKSVSGASVLVDNLPALFTSAGITEIQVATSPQTEFRNVSGAAELSAGTLISIRGFLFKTSGDPVLVADLVRKR